jgi:RNA polymerase sigma-70 factor (ECF subfamily)
MSEIDHQLHSAPSTRQNDLDIARIDAARNGCSSAFSELFHLYRPRVWGIIRSIVRNREDAEDALQDTFLRAYQALKGFRGDSSFYSWLVRIAINSSFMVLRKKRRHDEIEISQRTGEDNRIYSYDFVDWRPNPEQRYSQEQGYVRALRSVRRLPKQLGSVLELRVIEEQSIGEIQHRLGLTKAAIKARLFRARNRLAPDNRSRQFKGKIPVSGD